MLGFLLRYRGVIIGGGLTLVALGVLSSGREGNGVLGRSVGLLGAPVQTAVKGIAEGLGSVVDRYVFLVYAARDAELLRREVAELRRELLDVEEVAQENLRLKALLGFKEATPLRQIPARVVGRSATLWFQSLVLDKGSADGVVVDCPVTTPAGVVGRVFEVSGSASRVLLLTDPNSAVDAIVQRTRAQVLVEGTLGPTCRVLHLARGEEAAPGDRVVTSGLGGIFPKGLLLGEISHVEARPGDVFHAAQLAPSADFSRLEEVFVILPDGGDAP
ncbi:MAG: rod shape-determining protein MreC [Deferrisomatales bacterium]|nr:rod shape-determining protein MreC [Deferrisomatales bacterium]